MFGSVYNASKAALHSFSDTLRVELAPFGYVLFFHASALQSSPYRLMIQFYRVNVTTVVTGGVQSRIARTKRTLVPNSLYTPIEDEYNRRVTHSQDNAMPHEVYARSVVSQVLYGAAPWRWLWPWARGRKTWIWEGHRSWLIWFLAGGFAWSGLFGRIMTNMFKLSKLKGSWS